MTTDAERLRAAGHPITLAGGEVVPVRYSFAACVALEEKYGTLSEMSAALRFLVKPLSTVGYFVAAALDRPYKEVLDLLETQRMAEYETAILRAIAEAFPASDDEGKAEEATTASNGQTSTFSPPSDTDAAMATSGG